MIIEKRTFDRVALGVPKTWADNSIISYVGPPKDGVQPNLVMTQRPLPGKPDLAKYARSQKKLLERAEFEELTFVEEGPAVFGDSKFFRLGFTWTNRVPLEEEGQELKQTIRQDQYFILGEDRAVTLTFTCPIEAYEKFEPDFEEIVKNTAIE